MRTAEEKRLNAAVCRKRWKINNPEKVRESDRRWKKNNANRVRETIRRWFKNNPGYAKAYFKIRRETDLNFKLRCYLSSRIWAALKGINKSARTIELIGCTIVQLRLWLVQQFQPGMTWENYGEWHIDHIRPCASFDLSDTAQQRECFHWSNLQPLWEKDNLSKSDSLTWGR